MSDLPPAAVLPGDHYLGMATGLEIAADLVEIVRDTMASPKVRDELTRLAATLEIERDYHLAEAKRAVA